MPRLSAAVIVMLAVVLAAGCERFKSAEGLYEDGRALHAKGDYTAAVVQLKSAVQKNPHFPAARYLLGITHNELGNFADAEKELKRAQELGHDIAETNTALALALLGQEQYDRVLKEITIPAHASVETQARITALQGIARLGKGDRDAAAVNFAAALKLVPNQPEALVGQAWLAAQAGEREAALALAQRALDAAPRNKDAGLLKAALLRGGGKAGEAAAAYQAVLAVDAREVRAHSGLVSVYLEQNDLAAARAQVEAARKRLPNNLIVRFLDGQVSLREQNFAAARDAAQEVLKAAPNFLPAEYLLGLAQLALGVHEQAAHSLRIVVNQAPGSNHARAMLASAELSLGNPQRALDALKPALDAGTRYPTLLSMAGHVYLALNQPARAVQYFEAANTARDERTVAPGLALARQGGAREQGLADLATAAAPKTATPSDFALVTAYLRQGKFDEALGAIDRIEKKQPERPEAYYLRGMVYTAKRQPELARQSYEQAARVDPGHALTAVALANLDLRSNDRAAARKRYEAVLAKNKDDLTALLGLAALATQERNEAEAFDLLERAEKAHPRSIEPVNIQLQAYIGKKQFDKALAVAQRFHKANPDSNVALELLANTQQAAGDNQAALASLRELARRLPNSAALQLKLGIVQQALGKSADARESINKALTLQPRYLEAERALFLLDAETRGNEEAKKTAQRIQQNHPHSPLGYMLQGDAEMVLKQFERAIRSYEAAMAKGKGRELAIRLHQAYMAAGRLGEAEARIGAWLRDNPSDYETRFYLAQIYMATHQDKRAIEQYEALLKTAPRHAIAWNNLAWLYLKAKDPRALAAAEQAYKLRPEEAGITDTYGWMLVQQGDLARGVALLEQAHGKAKDNPEIQFHYAAALAKAGDKAKARSLLEPLVRGKPFPQLEDAKRLLAQL